MRLRSASASVACTSSSAGILARASFSTPFSGSQQRCKTWEGAWEQEQVQGARGGAGYGVEKKDCLPPRFRLSLSSVSVWSHHLPVCLPFSSIETEKPVYFSHPSKHHNPYVCLTIKHRKKVGLADDRGDLPVVAHVAELLKHEAEEGGCPVLPRQLYQGAPPAGVVLHGRQPGGHARVEERVHLSRRRRTSGRREKQSCARVSVEVGSFVLTRRAMGDEEEEEDVLSSLSNGLGWTLSV